MPCKFCLTYCTTLMRNSVTWLAGNCLSFCLSGPCNFSFGPGSCLHTCLKIVLAHATSCRWIVSYNLRHRKLTQIQFTRADLVAIDESILAFDESFRKTIAKHMATEGNTIKYHKLSHVTALMERLGNVHHFDANFYESDHRYVKGVHSRTSQRKNCIKEVVRECGSCGSFVLLLGQCVSTYHEHCLEPTC